MHALRTPLTAVLGYCELLAGYESEDTPRRISALITKVLETGYQITSLVGGDASSSIVGASSGKSDVLVACWSYLGHLDATLDLLASDEARLTEEQARYIERIRDAAGRLEGIIGSLLSAQ